MTPPAEPESFINPREIVAMLFRRRYWLIAPILLGLIGAIAAISMQKPMYRSSATLLIDSPSVPTSLVASPLTTVANERIAKIRQQIVSNNSLTSLIRETGLYAKERATLPAADVLDIMRNAISVDLVGASGGNNNTIAFTVAFTYENPAKAQEVTERLTKLFLVEDKRFRTEQATGTAAFLERRAEEFRRQLTDLEDKRRGVEARYAGALPEHVALSAQSGASLRAEVSRTDAETQGLAQQNSMLAVRARDDTPSQVAALRRAEDKLNQLSAVYADSYPEVRAARAEVELQRRIAKSTPAEPGEGLIQTEITSNHARLATLTARRGELIREIGEIEHRAAQAPQAAYELNMIEREYDNIKRQYESLREKQLDAQTTANLQTEDKGERFSVVDEPSMPHESQARKPLILLLAGLIAGTGAGVVLIVAFEMLMGTIHGETSLARITNAPPMGVLPPLHASTDGTQRNPLLQRAQAFVSGLGGERRVRRT
ncbi:MAG: lipopolysaccharide biosynthesis protein [Novosphingobium sp.]